MSGRPTPGETNASQCRILNRSCSALNRDGVLTPRRKDAKAQGPEFLTEAREGNKGGRRIAYRTGPGEDLNKR